MLFALAALLTALTTHAAAACAPGTWQNLTALPLPRAEHSVAFVNASTLAVVGGVVVDARGIVTTDLVQLYDLTRQTWKTVAPLPTALNHPNVVAVNNRLYVLGGLTPGPTYPGSAINWLASGASYVYDGARDAWTALAPMDPGTERGSANLGVYADTVYLAGGMTVLRDGYQDTVATVTAFNTTTGAWQRLPAAAAALPEGRQHALGAVVGDTLYVVGGRTFSQLQVRGEVFALRLTDLAAGWRTAPLRMPVPRGGIAGDAVNGSIYAFGGEGNVMAASGVFPQSEAFDTRPPAAGSSSWTELASMPVPRHGTHAAARGGLIYIPGGGLQQDGKAVTVDGVTTFSHPTAHFDAYCV